jgi:hypothetical protein
MDITSPPTVTAAGTAAPRDERPGHQSKSGAGRIRRSGNTRKTTEVKEIEK